MIVVLYNLEDGAWGSLGVDVVECRVVELRQCLQKACFEASTSNIYSG